MEVIAHEGELKRIKSFFSSSKDTYKLLGRNLLIKKADKTGTVLYK
jgi:hypothetical protein